MCRDKHSIFHYRRHGHGGCRSMKRHGQEPNEGFGPPKRCHQRDPTGWNSPHKEHRGKHFGGPSKRCHRRGPPRWGLINKEHRENCFDGPSKRCHREHHEKNHCMFGRKNHHSSPHHDFGSRTCERSASPRHHESHENHKSRHCEPSHHHKRYRHVHGNHHFGRRQSAEF